MPLSAVEGVRALSMAYSVFLSGPALAPNNTNRSFVALSRSDSAIFSGWSEALGGGGATRTVKRRVADVRTRVWDDFVDARVGVRRRAKEGEGRGWVYAGRKDARTVIQ